MFVEMALLRASHNGGVLFDYYDGLAPVHLANISDREITGQRFPLWGINSATGEWNKKSGFTTAWAVPRQTISGKWAAPCMDPSDPAGLPEPEWPQPLVE